MIAFVVPKISLIKVFLCGKNSLKLIYNVHDNFISFHAWAVCSFFTSKAYVVDNICDNDIILG